jgi:hypothetical protein
MDEEKNTYCEGIRNSCERDDSKICIEKDKTVRKEDKDTTIMIASKCKKQKRIKTVNFLYCSGGSCLPLPPGEEFY